MIRVIRVGFGPRSGAGSRQPQEFQQGSEGSRRSVLRGAWPIHGSEGTGDHPVGDTGFLRGLEPGGGAGGEGIGDGGPTCGDGGRQQWLHNILGFVVAFLLLG